MGGTVVGGFLGRLRQGGRRRSPRGALGTTEVVLDAGAVEARLDALGPNGALSAELGRRVDAALPTIVALSDLSSALAVEYVERVARPMGGLSARAGARLVVRGYLAHLLVEEDAAAFGAADVPVLGTLPPLRHGRPPQDLLTRVVKASRRQFEVICAITPEAWEGFVVTTTGDVHAEATHLGRGAGGAQGDQFDDDVPRYLSESLVDGLLRTGWVLRQVDLAYGQAPERR